MAQPAPSTSALWPGPTGLVGAQSGVGGGWLYDVLTRAGVSPSTAHDTVNFILRPVEILIAIAVAVLVAHLGARAIRRVVNRMASEAATRSTSPRAPSRISTVAALLANLWRFFVVVVTFIIILGMLGLDLTPLLASATVVGATIGFGAQSLVRDYLSGILLTMEDQFGIGDTVAVNDTTGVVEDLSLRVTRLRSADGTLWHLPNGDIRRLGNSTRGWAKASIELPATPGRVEELEQAKELLAGAAREVARSPRFSPGCTEPPEVLGIVAADGGTCTLRVALRTTPDRRDALERAMLEAALSRLLTNGMWPEPATAGDGTAPKDPASP